MNLYPLFADLEGRTVLVVGGGAVAERKIAAFLKSGARVRVIARALTTAISEHASSGRVDWCARDYATDSLNGAWLVIAATDDTVLNAQVARDAGARRIFVNVVDDASLSTFHVVWRRRTDGRARGARAHRIAARSGDGSARGAARPLPPRDPGSSPEARRTQAIHG